MTWRSKRTSLAVAAGWFVLCAAALAAEGEEDFALAIEKAHAAGRWRSQQALEAKIVAQIGEHRILDATLLFETPVGRVRMELADGTVAVFDGQKAWVAPADSPWQGARFHLLTWPYFAAVPMKLRDPGARLEEIGTRPLHGKDLPAARLTFAPGTGDTPDDWYVVYRDPDSSRLRAVAYIVTYGKPAAEAEKEPHSLEYGKFIDVDGVPIATEWTMYNWTEAEGSAGEPLGKVTLSELRFVVPATEAFAAPEGAREDRMPE
jgi:hypothetical protein